MNVVIELGRLTAEPKVKRGTSNGKDYTVALFSIAVDRRFQKDAADFFNCSAFGKTAEFIEKYFTKGSKILIKGSLQNDSYEKDGQKMTATKIIVDEVDFADSKQSAPKKPDDFVDVPEGIESDLPFR